MAAKMPTLYRSALSDFNKGPLVQSRLDTDYEFRNEPFTGLNQLKCGGNWDRRLP